MPLDDNFIWFMKCQAKLKWLGLTAFLWRVVRLNCMSSIRKWLNMNGKAKSCVFQVKFRSEFVWSSSCMIVFWNAEFAPAIKTDSWSIQYALVIWNHILDFRYWSKYDYFGYDYFFQWSFRYVKCFAKVSIF